MSNSTVKKTRLELVTELKSVVERKHDFKDLLADVSDFYTDEVAIIVSLNTNAYQSRKKYHGDSIDVNKEIFMAYANLEINKLEEREMEIIRELAK